jgi:protein JSN1
MQQPSRSLWIGNFDPSTTAQELMSVFAVYGPIESLRLLPDKVRTFSLSLSSGLRMSD